MIIADNDFIAVKRLIPVIKDMTKIVQDEILSWDETKTNENLIRIVDHCNAIILECDKILDTMEGE